MDRRSRKHIAKVLRAAASALEGAFDPREAMMMQQINRQRRNWLPLVNYLVKDVFGNKQTFTVYNDTGLLKYTLRSDWKDSGTPLAFTYMDPKGGIEKILPKTVDHFSSVEDLAMHIYGLLKKRRVKVVDVEQLEELD